MTVNSRRKGHNFERAVAAELRAIFDPPGTELPASRVRRGRQAEGAAEPDVVIDGAPWWLELKCGAKPDPLRALIQAEDDSERCRIPKLCVAVCKQDRHPATATMRLSTLLKIAIDYGVVMDRATVTLPWETMRLIIEGVETKNAPSTRGKNHHGEVR